MHSVNLLFLDNNFRSSFLRDLAKQHPHALGTQADNLRQRRGLIGVLEEAHASLNPKVAVEVTVVRTTGPRPSVLKSAQMKDDLEPTPLLFE